MEGKVAKVLRYVCGLLLLVGGLNKLLHFMPGPEHAEAAHDFMIAMRDTGYFIPLVGVVEAVVGAALLANYFVPLALVVLAPVSVNIVLFHLWLDPAGVGPAVFVAGTNLYLGCVNLSRFQDLLMPR